MTSQTTPFVKYDGNVPKTLRAYADKHVHQIADINGGDGYNTDSGFAYDILLRPGWRVFDDYCHTLIEPNIATILAGLRAIVPCDCRDCLAAIAKQQANGTSVTYW